MSASLIQLPENLKIPQRLTELVGEIQQEVYRRFGNDVSLIWFGSWIKGTARERSDIDLALDTLAPISNSAFAALRDWIDELPTLYSIDMVNLSETGEHLRKEIEKTGIRL